ncbi:hypothetical protein NBO_2g0088 [Nosema bombycis CQ1]|uniref:Uncharacterized protein n=1 Tax=Nosema bombycis (strain CQ1 / CVCC 102059) TaxID=578461 RepID=R0KZG3_NOSB1|nr:hypothetical protein NBO_2g0088 [Nosema bombycis CQ1]|eukprot:EOB15597.1 hypothetical protein NBO_2g0088 [Nosema bombycis CQ1]
MYAMKFYHHKHQINQTVLIVIFRHLIYENIVYVLKGECFVFLSRHGIYCSTRLSVF